MSAPDTSLETQKRRHRGPLVGMILVVVFGVGLIVYWLLEEAALSDPAPGTATQIDGRTGEPEDQPGDAPVEIPPVDPAPDLPPPSPTPDAPPAPPEAPVQVPETPAPSAPSPEIPARGAGGASGG